MCMGGGDKSSCHTTYQQPVRLRFFGSGAPGTLGRGIFLNPTTLFPVELDALATKRMKVLILSDWSGGLMR